MSVQYHANVIAGAHEGRRPEGASNHRYLTHSSSIIIELCYQLSSAQNLKLTSRLIKQGFWYNKLCIAFKKFSLNHMDIFSKYKVSLREHIHEGICLPLVAKNTLTRNIYSRHT